jgi:predicted ATPase
MKSLRLVNFKACRDVRLPLEPLTLLSGYNSTGKSCLLQSLLLLQQSYQRGLLPQIGLALNGDLVSIGSGKDALCEWAATDTIGFEIVTDDGETKLWQFQSRSDADVLPLLSMPTDFDFDIHYQLGGKLALDFLDSFPAGSLVMLDHPEHLLHASRAAKIGERIARAAARGVQVIVETHSDHILNGIRVAVHGGSILPEKVGLNHFSLNEKGVTQIKVLKIDRHGRIDRWPSGFFDEWDNTLEQLLEPVSF